MLWVKSALNEIKSINHTYDGKRSNSTSNTIKDIYARLDNLTASHERLLDQIARIDMAILALDRKVDEIWLPTPNPQTTAYPLRTYNRILVMSGDEPTLPSDVITIDTGAVKSFRVCQMGAKIGPDQKIVQK